MGCGCRASLLENCVDFPFQCFGREWLDDVVIDPGLEGFHDIFFQRLSRDQEDRQWFEVRIRTDRIKLSRIIGNLVGNAIKFTERGQVRLEAQDENSQSIRIIVSDTGEVLKIPNQALRFRTDRAGSPTQQADEASSASEPGTPAVVWVPGGNRRPAPLAVRVGLNDDVSTQLLAGPLTEGQPVIVGVANLRSGAGLFGFRLGF